MLNLSTPTTVAPYKYIFVMLDDVVLRPDTFRLGVLLDAIRSGQLHVASPAVERATHWAVMDPARHRGGSSSTSGDGGLRRTAYLELYAALFDRDAWGCFHSMFDWRVLQGNGNGKAAADVTSALGWGYDKCFLAHCPDVRLGVADSEVAVHRDRGVRMVTHYSSHALNLSELFGRRLALPQAQRARAAGQMQALFDWVLEHDHRRCATDADRRGR